MGDIALFLCHYVMNQPATAILSPLRQCSAQLTCGYINELSEASIRRDGILPRALSESVSCGVDIRGSLMRT